jgi:hypothetical protein
MIFLFDTTHFSQNLPGRRNRLCIIYLVGNELKRLITSMDEFPVMKSTDRRILGENCCVEARRILLLQVLPRQTCGLFTHTNFVSDFKGGYEGLEENFKGGELFITILYSPVSFLCVVDITMTCRCLG